MTRPLESTAPARALTELLSQVEHRMSRRVEGALGPDGLTLPQWRVLDLLARSPDGRPMTEIAAHAMVPAPTLTKIIDRLIDRALVYRRVDESDRRRVLVFLSEHGAATHRGLAPVVARVDEEIARELGGADLPRLVALLERLHPPAR